MLLSRACATVLTTPPKPTSVAPRRLLSISERLVNGSKCLTFFVRYPLVPYRLPGSARFNLLPPSPKPSSDLLLRLPAFFHLSENHHSGCSCSPVSILLFSEVLPDSNSSCGMCKGSGKGTQAERLVRKYGVRTIKTGDLLRRQILLGTEVGKIAEKVMKVRVFSSASFRGSGS